MTRTGIGMRRVFAALCLALAPAAAHAIADVQEAIDGALEGLPAKLGKIDRALRTIAVFPVKTDSESREAASVLQDKIVKVLIDSGRFKVIDREALEALLKEQALSLTGVVEERADMVKIGKIAGADAFMFGSASVSGATLTLTLKAVEVATSAIVWQETFSGESSAGGGRFGIGAGWMVVPVSVAVNFNSPASGADFTPSPGPGVPLKRPMITGAEGSASRSAGGVGVSLSYRQPLRYSRWLGFGVDVALGFIGDPGKVTVAGTDSANGNVAVTLTSDIQSFIYGGVGGLLYFRTRDLFRSKADRFNPFVGIAMTIASESMKNGDYQYAANGAYGHLSDGEGAGVFAANLRFGAEFPFTAHLSADVEGALAVGGKVRERGSIDYKYDLRPHAGPRLFAFLRYNL